MFYLYLIKNKLNNKLYIGWTSKPNERKYNHFKGRGSKLVASAIKKYGKENFSFEIIETRIERSEIRQLEIDTIAKLNTVAPNGYNITTGGDGAPGVVASDELRRFRSEMHKGKPKTEEHKKNLSVARKGEKHWWNHRKGTKHTEETRAKISEAGKGRKLSEETRKKLSLSKKGRPAHNKGKPISEETRAKLKNKIPWNKGMKMSDEFRQTMSKVAKGRVAWNKGKSKKIIPKISEVF